MSEKIIQCLIIDDEQHARDLINLYVENDSRLNCIGIFSNAIELENSKLIEKADLLFLDVEMPGKSGIDYLTTLKQPIKTVLTTAFKDYAFDGYNLNVIDFLLKPIFEERFKTCIDKIHQAFELEQKAKKFDSAQNFNNEYLIVKSGYDKLKIWLKDIIYISADSEYIRFHTIEKEHLIYMRLKDVEKLLPKSNFTRTHRSFIVSNSFVSKIKTDSLVLSNSTEIPISRSNKSDVEEILR